jgi:hypothetical protein
VEPSPSAAKFCLASTVNVNLLAEQALSSPEVDTEVVQPPPYPNNTGEEHEKTKMVRDFFQRGLTEGTFKAKVLSSRNRREKKTG